MFGVTNRYTDERVYLDRIYHVSINFTRIEYDRYTVTGRNGMNTVTIPITYDELSFIVENFKKKNNT